MRRQVQGLVLNHTIRQALQVIIVGITQRAVVAAARLARAHVLARARTRSGSRSFRARWYSLLHSMQSRLATLRSAMCPRLHGRPVKYRVRPAALALEREIILESVSASFP